MRSRWTRKERSGSTSGPKRARYRAATKGSAVKKSLSLRRSLSGPQYLKLQSIMPACRHRGHAEAHVRRDSLDVAPARTRLIILEQAAWQHKPKAQAHGQPSQWLRCRPLARNCMRRKNIWQYLRKTISPIECSKTYTGNSPPARNAWRKPSQRARPQSASIAKAADGAYIGYQFDSLVLPVHKDRDRPISLNPRGQIGSRLIGALAR